MKQGPIGRLLSHIRDFGFAGLHLRVLAGLNLYREMSVFELDLKRHQPELKAKISVTISEAANDEGHLLPSGETCFIAQHNGQIVSRLRRSVESYPIVYIDQLLELAPDQCYLHSAFTEPSYRNQGLVGALISHACKSTPHTSALVAITSYNLFSVRAFTKAGFRLKQVRGYYGLWRWRRHFCAQPPPGENTRSASA